MLTTANASEPINELHQTIPIIDNNTIIIEDVSMNDSKITDVQTVQSVMINNEPRCYELTTQIIPKI